MHALRRTGRMGQLRRALLLQLSTWYSQQIKLADRLLGEMDEMSHSRKSSTGCALFSCSS